MNLKSLFFGLILSVAFSSCTVISHKEFVEHDYRNANVPVVVTGIPFTGEITINMEKTDNYDFSMVDMQRCYFQAAEMLKDNDYKKVYLANKGEKFFFIDGSYFKDLGYSYSAGNTPILDMPSHVYNLDGTHAYETWSGGWLGVMNKQLEDLDDMIEKLVP